MDVNDIIDKITERDPETHMLDYILLIRGNQGGTYLILRM